jgi:hypothetical protein
MLSEGRIEGMGLEALGVAWVMTTRGAGWA